LGLVRRVVGNIFDLEKKKEGKAKA